MAQRDIPWEALLDQPFLAQAFGYSTPEEVAGTCILLLFSTPAAEKPSVESPEPREWAAEADCPPDGARAWRGAVRSWHEPDQTWLQCECFRRAAADPVQARVQLAAIPQMSLWFVLL